MARLNSGDAIDGGLALLYRAIKFASSEERSTGTVGFLIESRPLPLTNTSNAVTNEMRLLWSVKDRRQIISHRDGIALSLLTQAMNLLAINKPIVADAFDKARIVLGFDTNRPLRPMIK